MNDTINIDASTPDAIGCEGESHGAPVSLSEPTELVRTPNDTETPFVEIDSNEVNEELSDELDTQEGSKSSLRVKMPWIQMEVEGKTLAMAALLALVVMFVVLRLT